MIRSKRIYAILLVLIFCVSPLFSSCKKTDKNNIPETETVMTVSGHNVSYGLYRYFFLNYKQAYSEEELAADGAAIYEKIHHEVEGSLRGMFAIVDLCREYGISTEDADIVERVDATIGSIMEQYASDNDKTGERGYREELRANHFTESVFRYVCAVDMCEEALFIKLTGEGGNIPSDDDTVKAAIDRDFIRVLQVYINIEETDRTYEECKALADSVATKAKMGVDFNELVADHSNDFSMTRDGYYIPRGFMGEEFEAVAFALEVGEVSDVLELGDGFHIIKRFEKDPEYIEKNYEKLKERYLTCKFYEIVDAREATLTVEKTEQFSRIVFENIAMPE